MGEGPVAQGLRMMADPEKRGVCGFVAEIMATNDAMTRVAQGHYSSVSVTTLL